MLYFKNIIDSIKFYCLLSSKQITLKPLERYSSDDSIPFHNDLVFLIGYYG